MIYWRSEKVLTIRDFWFWMKCLSYTSLNILSKSIQDVWHTWTLQQWCNHVAMGDGRRCGRPRSFRYQESCNTNQWWLKKLMIFSTIKYHNAKKCAILRYLNISIYACKPSKKDADSVLKLITLTNSITAIW